MSAIPAPCGCLRCPTRRREQKRSLARPWHLTSALHWWSLAPALHTQQLRQNQTTTEAAEAEELNRLKSRPTRHPGRKTRQVQLESPEGHQRHCGYSSRPTSSELRHPLEEARNPAIHTQTPLGHMEVPFQTACPAAARTARTAEQKAAADAKAHTGRGKPSEDR